MENTKGSNLNQKCNLFCSSWNRCDLWHTSMKCLICCVLTLRDIKENAAADKIGLILLNLLKLLFLKFCFKWVKINRCQKPDKGRCKPINYVFRILLPTFRRTVCINVRARALSRPKPSERPTVGEAVNKTTTKINSCSGRTRNVLDWKKCKFNTFQQCNNWHW